MALPYSIRSWCIPRPGSKCFVGIGDIQEENEFGIPFVSPQKEVPIILSSGYCSSRTTHFRSLPRLSQNAVMATVGVLEGTGIRPRALCERCLCLLRLLRLPFDFAIAPGSHKASVNGGKLGKQSSWKPPWTAKSRGVRPRRSRKFLFARQEARRWSVVSKSPRVAQT